MSPDVSSYFPFKEAHFRPGSAAGSMGFRRSRLEIEECLRDWAIFS